MENRIEKLLNYPGDMEAEAYVYTAGELGEKFLMSLRDEGKIKAAFCSYCEKLFLPVRSFCIFCGKEVNILRDIEQEGYIESFTKVKLDSSGNEIKEPFYLAYIKFKGVEGGLLHKLGEVKEELKIGMKVIPVFKEKSQRRGSLEDIAYFKLISNS
jgi:uncharacterized OB-fold protein